MHAFANLGFGNSYSIQRLSSFYTRDTAVGGCLVKVHMRTLLDFQRYRVTDRRGD